MSTRLLMLAAGLLGWALALSNTSVAYDRPLDKIHRHTSRFWDETAVAGSHVVNRGRVAPLVDLASNDGGDLRNAFKRYVPREAAAASIQPWQFWRTIEVKPFLRRARLNQRPYDDPGRALLLRLGYHVFGGVAPYLAVWLGVLAMGPALVWLAWELGAAGRRVEGVVLPLLLGLSGFVVDVLGLPYSAAGFYVVAAALLVAFSVYALLSPSVTPRGLLARGLAAGLGFALCACTRSSTLLLAGGFLAAAACGAWRASAGGSRRARGLLALGVAATLLVPYALVRPSRHHGVWGDLWQGLGDFDRTRGHAWSDGELRKLLRREGVKIGRNVGTDFESKATEAVLRRIFIDDLREAPAWYAGILARRVVWTLTQWKLHPYGPTDGISIAPQTSENEGLTDAYYAMVTPLDVFVLGGWRREVRLEWLWLPPLGLLAAWGLARRRGAAETARRLGGSLLLLACLVLATLPVPVLISTSSTFETQTFAFVYFCGAAFAAGELTRLARRRA